VRLFLLGMFFLGCVVTGPALVVVWVLPGLPGLFGVPPAAPVGGWQALAVAGVGIPLMFLALYVAGLLWLVCACRLFHRHEVERIASVGPSTGLERWLLERLAPESPGPGSN